jgi:hypothetical protein
VASGLESSVVGDGLKNGQTSALSVEPADFAGSYLQDDGNNNLQVDISSVATRSWVNNNADVPNADYADSAGNADQLDGNHASAFLSSSDLTNHTNDEDAHHSRPSFNDETGTTSYVTSSSGNTVNSVSFSSTYQHASPVVYISSTSGSYAPNAAHTAVDGEWAGWRTDGSGNITGMDVRISLADFDPVQQCTLTATWEVLGVEV